ncbi:MAG TPA: single-stranded-DNA-specific exonuclease RecJ, partial [Campylobacterales bacterium]|nr:single-stranded-DNA-specific exonuclease RecJ [Campylobacterales bacterium]
MYPPVDFASIGAMLQARFSQEGFLSLSDLPHPSRFKDMNRATERIVHAIRTHQKIVLIGDYDVDGVVSTTLIKRFFEAIDYPLEWIIPNRFRDGYGLSANIVPRIVDFDLAITVDNGIAAVEAATLCAEHGIELIITDHHMLPKQLPQAYAIVNQKQSGCDFPYDEVCGAQIAWYLIASLNHALAAQVDTKSYIELLAIAIIADMMPLQHINRAMVTAGLKLLSRSSLPAIQAFRERLDKEDVNAEDIGFQMAPILNSAGRMDDASWSVEFLLSQNIYDARVRLERLVGFNEQRKVIEQQITEEAMASVNPEDDVIVVQGERWHEGVVGIVAARIGRRCEKPTIVLTRAENGEFKGSGRSFSECNLFKITHASKDLLSKFGGHHAAIGLSLPEANLEAFKQALQQSYRDENYTADLVDPEILGELPFSEISFDLIALLKQYEPYGQANSRPKFITTGVTIEDVSVMGKEGDHRRFLLSHQGVL